MKKLFIIPIILCAVLSVNAQQLPQFTQFYLNKYVANPAFAGSQPFWEAQLNTRFQWVGIEDAPRTNILSVNGALNNRKMGLGGYLFSDNVGPTQRSGISASYAYHVKLTDELKLGVGVNAGGLQMAINGQDITLENSGDAALSNGTMQVVTYDAGAGIYLYTDEFWFSFSAPQLIGNKLEFFEDYEESLSSLERHYYAGAGYSFEIANDFKVEPSFFAKYVDPIPPQFDVALRVIYADMIWAAGSYKLSAQPNDDNAIGIMLGGMIQENLMFGYSFELPTSDVITQATSGSHEIMIGLRFKNRDK